MSLRPHSLSSSLLTRIDRQIDRNFTEQVEFLKQLIAAISVNSASADTSKPNDPIEKKAAKLIFDRLKLFGLLPKRIGVSPERPNVICTYGPERFRKSLLLNGHLDTVPAVAGWNYDPFSPVVKDGKLYGLGALDMKGTLSVYVYALRAILKEKIRLDGRLTLAFVVDEEAGAASEFGTAYLMQKGIKGTAGIVGEPGSGKICIGHRGGYRFRLTTIGESVHTGVSAWERKEKGRNAIVDMARVVNALLSMELPYRPARAFPGRIPVFTFPTVISGGTSINSVPDRCVAEGDVRLLPGNTGQQVRMWIEDAIAEKCSDVAYELEDLVYVPSIEIDKGEEVVSTLVTHATAVLGQKPRLAGAGPWNDAWMMATHDIPTIAGFGPDGENAHGADEYVRLDSLKAVTKIYVRLILDYLGT